MGPIAPPTSARAEFALVPAFIPGTGNTKGSNSEARHFLDIQVDGRSLRELVPDAIETVTSLCVEWDPGEVSRAARALTGVEHSAEPGLESGEVPLLICPACGDLDCGAVVARVEVDADTVTWRGLRWVGAGARSPDDEIDDFGSPLTFERGAYERTLGDAVRRVADLAQ